MEQFKVGDLVRCIDQQEKPFGRIGKVVNFSGKVYSVDFGEGFDGHSGGGIYSTMTYWNLYERELELAYPSDHDLLDFASRDSKIAELTAKVSELEAELEKYKPKPESVTIDLYLYRDYFNKLDWSFGNSGDKTNILARKTVTITEGEGM